MSVPPRRPGSPLAIPLAFGLALVGCDQPTGSTRPRSAASSARGVDPEPAAPQAAPPPREEVGPRPILNRRTQDIRDVAREKQAGGVVTTPGITAKDPITLQGNAYVYAIGKTSIDQIEYALKLYQAETGEFPRTYDEFMEKIIKANNIALPTLPFYQEYGYDAPTHRLVVIEYPDRKAKANYPR